MVIGADTGQNDVVLLPALERVHASNFNLIVQLLPHGTIPEHDLQYVAALTLIGSDDTYLLWSSTSFQELGHNLLYIGSLCMVQQMLTQLQRVCHGSSLTITKQVSRLVLWGYAKKLQANIVVMQQIV